MKITRNEGENLTEFEVSVEWHIALSGKPEWKQWMGEFDSDRSIDDAFLWSDSDEGFDWWRYNHHKTTGIDRFEEMKREYKAWMDENDA